MRKDELVHLHNLLTLVREEFVARGDAPSAAFEDYDELGVSPMAVYGSKTDHQRAVQALAGPLADAAAADADSDSGSGTEDRGVQVSSD